MLLAIPRTLLIAHIGCDQSHLLLNIISTACFRISFFINKRWFSLCNFINSSSSGVRLSFLLKEPDVLNYFTHLSKVDGISSYSLKISTRGFPFSYSLTNWLLNSGVKIRRVLFEFMIETLVFRFFSLIQPGLNFSV